MKFLCLLLILPNVLFAQLGIKAGLNFAKISNAKEINKNSKSGFHAGLFLAPAGRNIISSRTELLFSRQGYNYQTSTLSGDVNLDYIQVAQFMSVNITKFVSLMFGAQTAYLVSAATDSVSNAGSSAEEKFMDLYNRVDYGYAVGAEFHPVAGLVLGARYNVSLANVYKDLQTTQRPSFTTEDAKNNVIQISAGWRFGKTKTKKSRGKAAAQNMEKL